MNKQQPEKNTHSQEAVDEILAQTKAKRDAQQDKKQEAADKAKAKAEAAEKAKAERAQAAADKAKAKADARAEAAEKARAERIEKKQAAQKETAGAAPYRAKRHSKKSRLVALLGALVLLFTVIGLVDVVKSGISLVGNIAGGTARKEMYEDFILPVVMYDPIPFEWGGNAEKNMILQSSLWSVLLNNDQSRYTVDESGSLIVPANDVEVQAARLFGPDIAISHQTVGDYQTSYIYDAETDVYYVPLAAQPNAFSPRVTSITENSDGTITLVVGYISPAIPWDIDRNDLNYKAAPAKYMDYILAKGDLSGSGTAGYYIYAVRSNTSYESGSDGVS